MIERGYKRGRSNSTLKVLQPLPVGLCYCDLVCAEVTGSFRLRLEDEVTADCIFTVDSGKEALLWTSSRGVKTYKYIKSMDPGRHQATFSCKY